jgi:hypothetical protein
MDNNVSYGGSPLPQIPPQNSSTKYYVIMMILGISVMTATTSLVAPRVILWWYDSPASTPITSACVSGIDWAIRMLQWAQLIALILGAIAGLIVGYKFRKQPQSNPLNTR